MYGFGSRPAVRLPVDGPTTFQPVVAHVAALTCPGCGCGCAVACGGPCTVNGMLLAVVGPAEKVPICLPLPSYRLCMHDSISRGTCFLLASSVPCPHASTAHVRHHWWQCPTARCPQCSKGESWCTWCEWCCVHLHMFLPASRVLGSLLPHAASCPPGVRARVPCSSCWVVPVSWGLRALGYVGPVLLWSSLLCPSG